MSGDIPNSIEWNALPNTALHAPDEEEKLSNLILASTSIFRCPVSDHLFIFWSGFGDDPTVYAPMKEVTAGR
jgi:hypothetical protein